MSSGAAIGLEVITAEVDRMVSIHQINTKEKEGVAPALAGG